MAALLFPFLPWLAPVSLRFTGPWLWWGRACEVCVVVRHVGGHATLTEAPGHTDLLRPRLHAPRRVVWVLVLLVAGRLHRGQRPHALSADLGCVRLELLVHQLLGRQRDRAPRGLPLFIRRDAAHRAFRVLSGGQGGRISHKAHRFVRHLHLRRHPLTVGLAQQLVTQESVPRLLALLHGEPDVGDLGQRRAGGHPLLQVVHGRLRVANAQLVLEEA